MFIMVLAYFLEINPFYHSKVYMVYKRKYRLKDATSLGFFGHLIFKLNPKLFKTNTILHVIDFDVQIGFDTFFFFFLLSLHFVLTVINMIRYT